MRSAMPRRYIICCITAARVGYCTAAAGTAGALGASLRRGFAARHSKPGRKGRQGAWLSARRAKARVHRRPTGCGRPSRCLVAYGRWAWHLVRHTLTLPSSPACAARCGRCRCGTSAPPASPCGPARGAGRGMRCAMLAGWAEDGRPCSAGLGWRPGGEGWSAMTNLRGVVVGCHHHRGSRRSGRSRRRRRRAALGGRGTSEEHWVCGCAGGCGPRRQAWEAGGSGGSGRGCRRGGSRFLAARGSTAGWQAAAKAGAGGQAGQAAARGRAAGQAWQAAGRLRLGGVGLDRSGDGAGCDCGGERVLVLPRLSGSGRAVDAGDDPAEERGHVKGRLGGGRCKAAACGGCTRGAWHGAQPGAQAGWLAGCAGQA